jgi:tetratricopeptide (TPR) repeat protein
MLVFEKPEGGADQVPAASVAQVLKEARVPVVVLNACQSGAVGKELEAAVATRLLQEGVSAVVAMAYSVYAVAAAEFMAAFYERLFEGKTVTDAVGAGRRRLFRSDGRPSPKGELALADWVVPVHYRRRDISFPALATPRAAPQALETMLDELRELLEDRGGEGALDPVGTFVGRDALFYELEVACRAQRAVVLHGPGGTGKTELAKAFGRWWRDTAGAELVVLHSFEPGVASFGLDGVLAAIGLQAFGADFARVALAEREAIVLRMLRERRLLLIWDNFESVVAMPDPAGATPPLDEPERERLRRFVAAIAAGGRSALLVTSRTTERWLGDEIARRPVGGLTRAEASEYADALLAASGSVQARRSRPAFGELLVALDGHPLSMRLVLPHVATRDPEALLAALRGSGDLPGGGGTDRLASLERCVGYSFEHLDPATRRLLPAVSLFHGVVDADVLELMSAVDGVPKRFAGRKREQWSAALDAAAAVGLPTSIGAGMSRIHPALPAYLSALWRQEADGDHDSERARGSSALLSAYAAFGDWLREQMRTGDADFALRIVELQRRTIGHLFGAALQHGRWAEAQSIAQPLNEYFNSRGLYEEARGWVDRVRVATESHDGALPDLQAPAGALWILVAGSQANREFLQGHLERSERTYLELRDALAAQKPSPTQQRHLANANHGLGIVAHKRGHLDDAEDAYRQALTIHEEIGNRPGITLTYHQLGIVAFDRGHLDDAEDAYRQALEIHEEIGNRPGIANTYHQLGIVAQGRGRLDDAEDWYRQSLMIKEVLGNRPGMASTYHQLGTVAQTRGRLDDAEDWYRRSLTINEALGNRPGMAMTYHELGRVAQARGRLDDAEDWYRRSLSINEELGNRPDLAKTYGQLGLLAEARDEPTGALEWMVRCVALFDEFPHPATGPGPDHLARLTGVLGVGALEAAWLKVTGSPLPAAVREHVGALTADDDHEGSDDG